MQVKDSSYISESNFVVTLINEAVFLLNDLMYEISIKDTIVNYKKDWVLTTIYLSFFMCFPIKLYVKSSIKKLKMGKTCILTFLYVKMGFLNMFNWWAIIFPIIMQQDIKWIKTLLHLICAFNVIS